MQTFRIDDRCRLQRLHRRHSVLDERLELSRILTVWKGADVAAVADRHAGGQRRTKAPMLEGNVRRHRIDSFPPAIADESRLRRRQRRTDGDAALAEKGEEFRCHRVTMLDRRHAGAHGTLDA